MIDSLASDICVDPVATLRLISSLTLMIKKRNFWFARHALLKKGVTHFANGKRIKGSRYEEM